jgi:nicotinate-nucleotide adenylyltransferase
LRATGTSAPDHPAPSPGGIGILGGTFNPPHRGHLALARHARDELSLGRLLLMPARLPPHKPDASDPGPVHRLAMCELAVEREPLLSVSALELEREGPSYTVDTLNSVHESNPGVELTFILGADIAGTLPTWREPERLLSLANLAVASRNGSDRGRVLDAVASLGAPGGPVPAAGSGGEHDARPRAVRFLSMAPVEVSSSAVRERVRAGEPIEDLVGEAVARYIAEHGLYTMRSKDGNK